MAIIEAIPIETMTRNLNAHLLENTEKKESLTAKYNMLTRSQKIHIVKLKEKEKESRANKLIQIINMNNLLVKAKIMITDQHMSKRKSLRPFGHLREPFKLRLIEIQIIITAAKKQDQEEEALAARSHPNQ